MWAKVWVCGNNFLEPFFSFLAFFFFSFFFKKKSLASGFSNEKFEKIGKRTIDEADLAWRGEKRVKKRKKEE